MQLEKIYVVLGPPGSGKGTQSELLAKFLAAPRIVIGDLIREFIKEDSDEAFEAKERYDKGIPQPDSIATMLLERKLKTITASNVAVFDTFPLSMGQAEDLDRIATDLRINDLKAVFLNVDQEEVVKRISARKICGKCKNVSLPGQMGYEDGKCNVCGGDLVVRSDDRPEIARARFEEYEKRNLPIKQHYREKGILVEINGDQPIEDVHKNILSSLGL